MPYRAYRGYRGRRGRRGVGPPPPRPPPGGRDVCPTDLGGGILSAKGVNDHTENFRDLMLDLYSTFVIIGIASYACYNCYMLWYEAHNPPDSKK